MSKGLEAFDLHISGLINVADVIPDTEHGQPAAAPSGAPSEAPDSAGLMTDEASAGESRQQCPEQGARPWTGLPETLLQRF